MPGDSTTPPRKFPETTAALVTFSAIGLTDLLRILLLYRLNPLNSLLDINPRIYFHLMMGLLARSAHLAAANHGKYATDETKNEIGDNKNSGLFFGFGVFCVSYVWEQWARENHKSYNAGDILRKMFASRLTPERIGLLTLVGVLATVFLLSCFKLYHLRKNIEKEEMAAKKSTADTSESSTVLKAPTDSSPNFGDDPPKPLRRNSSSLSLQEFLASGSTNNTVAVSLTGAILQN